MDWQGAIIGTATIGFLCAYIYNCYAMDVEQKGGVVSMKDWISKAREMLGMVGSGPAMLDRTEQLIHKTHEWEDPRTSTEGEIVSNRRDAVETGFMLKARREEIGLSQKELAAMLPPALGMTQQRIAHYEAGTRAQYYYEITALTNALQLDDRDVMFK